MAQFGYTTQTYEGNSVQVPIPPSKVYEGRRLGEEEVRILSLHKADDAADKSVKCSLWYASLREVPKFTALSYQWGDPSRYKVITVNEMDFPVTINCFSALMRLRNQEEHENLWIDAICINQQDLDEKQILVRRMEDIFHSANHVIAWLGAAETGSSEVMRMLSFTNKSRQPTESEDRIDPWEPGHGHLIRYRESALALFRRSYWRRAWVTQEISLASRLLILCGSDHASWKGLELFLELFSPYMNTLKHVPRKDRESMQHMNRLCNLRRNRIEGLPTGLLEVLQNCVNTQATKARDRVYSLLALAYDSKDFVSKLNYDESTPLDLICMDITKNVVWSKRSLDIIFFGKKEIPHRTLPSWCPEYTNLEASNVDDRLAKYLSGSDERFRVARKCRRWNTFGDEVLTHDQIKFSQDDVLIAYGIRYDTVYGLGRTADGKFDHQYAPVRLVDSKEDNKVLFHRIGRALSLYKEQQKGSGESQALWHVFDLETVMRKKIPDDWEIIRAWKSHNEDFRVCDKSLKDRGTGLRARKESGVLDHYLRNISKLQILNAVTTPEAMLLVISNSLEDRKPALSLAETLSAMADLMREGLRIMTTHSNNIGWAHPGARVGDEIFLISGCSMPAILRKSERYPGSYSVVGHVYLEGVMDNEVWSKVHHSKLGEIRLR